MVCFLTIAAPQITSHPANATEVEGNNATLSCNASGDPVLTISWTKDGSLINSDSRISFGSDNKELIITSVRRADRGQYRCIASNRLGNSTSNAATLDVQCKYSRELAMFI